MCNIITLKSLLMNVTFERIKSTRVEENTNISFIDEAKITSEIIIKLPILLLSQFEITFELHRNYDVLTQLIKYGRFDLLKQLTTTITQYGIELESF